MGRKILVVDDDEDVRRMLRRILETEGEVVEAADGESALCAVGREKPVVMLLDVTMPGVDGMAVLERARAIAPHLIVVMLTGQTDLAVARSALEHGARAYITKPFDPEDIRTEVRRLTGGTEEDDPRRESPPWRVLP